MEVHRRRDIWQLQDAELSKDDRPLHVAVEAFDLTQATAAGGDGYT